MLKHYLKTAFRNLNKYRQHNVISIIGLAIGFVCFALSVLWIRYELTYDDFHRDADRIYRVRTKAPDWDEGICPVTPFPLSGYLKSRFPEVDAACTVNGWENTYKANDRRYEVYTLEIDSSFYDLFDLSVRDGNLDFLRTKTDGIAITPELATRMFGKENPIGKKIEYFGAPLTVEAVVNGWSSHSNMPFEAVRPLRLGPNWQRWDYQSYRTYIRLKKHVDPQEFFRKAQNGSAPGTDGRFDFSGLIFTPIQALHYTVPDEDIRVKFSHVFLFALAGLLVIFCSLFNYLTLFVNSLKIRSKEFALRKINGSSNKSLFLLLVCEIGIILIAAILIGIMLIEWGLTEFKQLSGITTAGGGIYAEALAYGGLIAAATVLLVLIPALLYFRRQTLYASLKEKQTGNGRNLFRKTSILLQLFISICFIFCTAVIYRQINDVLHAGTGIDQENTATVDCYPADMDAVYQQLQQIPSIKEVIKTRAGFIPANSRFIDKIKPEEKRGENDPAVSCEVKSCDEHFIPFFRIPFVEGRTLSHESGSAREVVINEKAMKDFGWKSAVGKRLVGSEGTPYTVIGVVKDFIFLSPTAPVKPMIFVCSPSAQVCLIRYLPEDKEKCCGAVEAMISRHFPNAEFSIYPVDDLLKESVSSDRALLSMLGFVSVVCIVVSLFGVYSLAVLICERRKKEIAIRKILGAGTGNILAMFYHEFLFLASLAALLAFGVSYSIMKPWKEQYTRQVEIGPELYICIFLAVTGCILLTVGWLIWKTVRANPAEVIQNK